MALGAILSKIDGTELEYEINTSKKENEGLPKEYSYMYNLPKVINQEIYPICVPCSISSWLNWKLNITNGKNTFDNKIKVFDIFDNGGGTENGMTCKDAFKYLINTGVKYKDGITKISKYYKVSTLIALKHAIVANGPCVAILPVYNLNTNFWEESSNFLGYHAISIVGYDENGFIIRNSWGSSYGENGYSYITNKDMNKSVEIWTLC